MDSWLMIRTRIRVTFFLSDGDILSEELSALRKTGFLLIYSPRSVKKNRHQGRTPAGCPASVLNIYTDKFTPRMAAE
jgi:hypothetical protein